MIEGLERVARADLSHAYGSADDVPDLLHRMTGTDETDVITVHPGGIAHLLGDMADIQATIAAIT
jgi:hypothetical protein